jgi:hypothetical protein
MRLLRGTALVVAGGGMVFGAGVVGFVAGASLVLWTTEQEEERKKEAAKARARYESNANTTLVVSEEWPASGTNFSIARKEEINDSSVAEPVYLTFDEIMSMDMSLLKPGFDSGRFKFVNVDPRDEPAS